MNPGTFLTSYAFFYFCQLSVNAFSLALYGVMAFTTHLPCKADKDAPNATALVVLNFLIGFILQFINFVVTGFVEPSLRATYHRAVYEEGLTSEVRKVFIIVEMIEYIFRFLFIVFSLYQIVSLGSPGVKYCTLEL